MSRGFRALARFPASWSGFPGSLPVSFRHLGLCGWSVRAARSEAPAVRLVSTSVCGDQATCRCVRVSSQYWVLLSFLTFKCNHNRENPNPRSCEDLVVPGMREAGNTPDPWWQLSQEARPRISWMPCQLKSWQRICREVKVTTNNVEADETPFTLTFQCRDPQG